MKVSKEVLEYIESVFMHCTSRARWAIEHMIENGSISSVYMLENGHLHPARVIGDVRDQGIPVNTKTINHDGKRIAQYSFGTEEEINRAKFGGRKPISKRTKQLLLERNGKSCQLSGIKLDENELQIDHRIPFTLIGEPENPKCTSNYMLLSKSMQRTKSWACESCPNLKKHRKIKNCLSCYWASPEHYTHKAMENERVVSLVWDDADAVNLAKMQALAESHGLSVQTLIKNTLSAIY